MPTDPLESAHPSQATAADGTSAVAFHWTMFVLVVIVGILCLLHDDLPKEAQGFWIDVHALLGLVLWFTLFARFFWHVRHAPLALPEGIGAISRRFSSPVHRALYALMFLTPILGLVTFVHHGRIFDFGLFHIDCGIKTNRAVFSPTEDIHGFFLAYALFALAGLHALAPLWHRFYLHDGVLARMWSFARRPLKPGVQDNFAR